jgi:glutathione S-transferase
VTAFIILSTKVKKKQEPKQKRTVRGRMIKNLLRITSMLRKPFGVMRMSLSASASNSMELYGMPLSQPTRSVMLLCAENNIPYNLTLVDARKFDTKKPEFLKLFPVGYAPAINDEGFLLTESAAVMQYLCEKHQLTSWYPFEGTDGQAIQARAKVNFWLHWHHGNMRCSTRSLLVPSVYPPKGKTREEALAKGAKEFSRGVKYLESYLKQRYEKNAKDLFLCSSASPTIADLMVLPEVDQLTEKGMNLFDFTPSECVEMGGPLCQGIKLI